MNRDRRVNLAFRCLEVGPLVLSAALAAYSVVVVMLLLMGRLNNLLVWPLGLAAALAAGAIVWRTYRSQRPGSVLEQRIFDVLVVVGVTIWIVGNAFLTAHSVFITRDPGIYTVTGKWLMTHQSTNIETPSIVSGVRGVYNQSSGIWKNPHSTDKGELQPQGAHLLPALLGLAGRIFGDPALSVTNVVFGGGALLVAYGFMRQLAKPRWAATGTAVLAASLPMLYFSRDSYTEPLAVLFTMGALTFVWLAQAQAEKASPWLWAIAGLVAGAGVLTRPDGYFTIIAILAFLLVAAITFARRDSHHYQHAAAFVSGAALSAFVGWLDIYNLTASYYSSQRKAILGQLALMAATLVGGAAVIAISRRTTVLLRLERVTRRWRADATLVAVLLVWLILISRPLWLHTMTKGGGPATGLVNVLQGRLGDPITWRIYTELTLQWITWYLGLPFLFLGLVGLATALRDMMKGHAQLLMAGAFVFGLTTLLYALRPSITPDQIWAARRFLPVVFPMCLAFGVYALDRLTNSYFERQKRLGYILAALLAVFLVTQPLITSRPFLLHREKGYDYQALTATCSVLPKNALVIWLGNSLENDGSQSVRAFCGVQALGYDYHRSQTYLSNKLIDQTALQQIARQAYAKGYQPILAIHSAWNDRFTPPMINRFTPVGVYVDSQLQQTLAYPPTRVDVVGNSVELALLTPTGTIARFAN